MSARPRTSERKMIRLASVAEERFLRKVMTSLEELRRESNARGHMFLASLLEITRGAAEDDLNTRTAGFLDLLDPDAEEDDGVVQIAEKWSARAKKAS